jgi:hypothetical protein
MTLYYVKQDDTIWGCGDPECCGEYYEEIEESFVECKCGIPEEDMTADHLHVCNGGGPVLKWRKAKKKEVVAFRDGETNIYYEAFEKGIEFQKTEDARKLKTKRDKTIHELVHEGYTVIVQGAGGTETYYKEEENHGTSN